MKLNKKDKRLLELGFTFASQAPEFLERAVPGAGDDPVSMGAFSGSAVASLLSTAFASFYEMTTDRRASQDWLTATLGETARNIGGLLGMEIKIVMILKDQER